MRTVTFMKKCGESERKILRKKERRQRDRKKVRDRAMWRLK